MQSLTEQIKKFIAPYIHGDVAHMHYAKAGQHPQRDWLALLSTFFIGLCLAGVLAFSVNYSAHHASSSDTVGAQNTGPTLDTATLQKVNNYFNAKAQSLQQIQNGQETIPSDPSK